VDDYEHLHNVEKDIQRVNWHNKKTQHNSEHRKSG
jgi:hypothetical protein